MGQLLQQTFTWQNGFIMIAWAIVLLFIVLGFVTYAIYFERKVIGWMQLRHGPTRVGPLGLLQTVADILKLLLKEDTIPRQADKVMFVLAPVITYVPAFAVLATIPYSSTFIFADLNIGVFYYVALSSISTLGMLLAGWSSNNKYSLLGGMRAVAQMISYEIPLVLSVVGIIMLNGSLHLRTLVAGQGNYFWEWNFIPQCIGFAVFVIAGVAELNRTPFDLPEAESELVAGYHVEYSGFRFAFFMLAEYVYVFALSALTTILFFGGWNPPLPYFTFIPDLLWFMLKFSFCVFFLFWLRATMPRIRVDQLMGFGWKVLLPLALLNIFLTAIYIEIYNK